MAVRDNKVRPAAPAPTPAASYVRALAQHYSAHASPALRAAAAEWLRVLDDRDRRRAVPQ